MKRANELIPAVATHPGELLAEELEERNLTQQAIAKQIGVSQAIISQLLHKKRRVSLEMALRLEQVLDISAEFWLNLQRQYDRVTAYHNAQKSLRKLNLPEPRQIQLLEAILG
jgi:HTH-type transcriptional regulator/antitoxin HigA